MNDPANHDALSEVLYDPLLIRLVTVVNLASLSILELLEYGFTQKDISRAMARGVVEFDRSVTLKSKSSIAHVLGTGDYYFESLGSKIRLAQLGILMLEIIEGEVGRATSNNIVGAHEGQDAMVHHDAPHL